MRAPLYVIEYFSPFVQVSADPEFVPEDDNCFVECETKVGIESNFEKNGSSSFIRNNCNARK